MRSYFVSFFISKTFKLNKFQINRKKKNRRLLHLIKHSTLIDPLLTDIIDNKNNSNKSDFINGNATLFNFYKI